MIIAVQCRSDLFPHASSSTACADLRLENLQLPAVCVEGVAAEVRRDDVPYRGGFEGGLDDVHLVDGTVGVEGFDDGVLVCKEFLEGV